MTILTLLTYLLTYLLTPWSRVLLEKLTSNHSNITVLIFLVPITILLLILYNKECNIVCTNFLFLKNLLCNKLAVSVFAVYLNCAV